MKNFLAFLIVAVCLSGMSVAGQLEKGDTEIAFRLSHSRVDFGSADDYDVGQSQDTDLLVSAGFMLSKHHQLGLNAGYVNSEFSESSVVADSQTDGYSLGVFYSYNFPPRESVTPYLGVGAGILGGDAGDLYDSQYGGEIGLKIYPYEHAGILVGLNYTKMQAEDDLLPDADAFSFGAGLIIKF